ncbi:MAG TPA: hypothetical protein VK622_00035 [Puia sp.]|nr:hypothetical protein [Puia sp.]
MRKLKFKIWDAQKIPSQRNDLKFGLPAGSEELNSEETKIIVGGEGIAFWLGYAAGKITQFFS